MPQSVQVAAANDNQVESFHRSSIFHASSSTDPDYEDVGLPRVIVNIIDDDYAGVMIIPSDGSTDVAEGGASDTYEVVLTKAPTQNVTINLENVSGQVVAVDDDNPATSVLLFTPLNWDTPKTVRVTADDDTQLEGTHETYITQRLSSADEEYQQVFALQELGDLRGHLITASSLLRRSVAADWPKRRLHDTINSSLPLLHFSGDGTGRGTRWELVPPNLLDGGKRGVVFGDPPGASPHRHHIVTTFYVEAARAWHMIPTVHFI